MSPLDPRPEGRPPPDGPPPPEAASLEEALYDDYLEAALAGRALPPEDFLAAHAAAGPELRRRLDRLWEGASAGSGRRPAGPRPGSAPGVPFERLGEFRLLGPLGTGGMGLVFAAEQEPLGRRVAVKIVRPELAGSASAAERFRREARAAARLRHPGIVRVLGAGEDQGVLFLAMELVPGRTLDAILEEAEAAGERLPAARVLRWGARLARALDHAHAEGVVHRDVKPGNVLVTPQDEPLLLDFGVARLEAEALPTLTGPFVGTPHYAPPEQLAGRAVDRRADVYGLGATLYECLTGRRPFDGETADEVFRKVLVEPPVPPRRIAPNLPRDVEVVVLQAMDKEPARRYATAAAFAEDLEALLEFRAISARPPGPLRRARAWVRRRPALAAAAGTAALSAAVLAFLSVAAARAEADRVRREAAAEVAGARSRLRAFRARRLASAGLEQELADLEDRMESRYVPPEDDRRLARRTRELVASRRERAALFHEVLEGLRRAERLDPATPGLDAVRGALYAEKWREGLDARDAEAAGFYARLARAADPQGPAAREVLGLGALTLTTEPRGASVDLFRYVEQVELEAAGEEGEARLVPVPHAGAPPEVVPGTWCLRVVAAGEGLAPEDLILEVAGEPVRDRVLVTDAPGLPRGTPLTSVAGHAVRSLFDVEEAERSPGPRSYAFGQAPPAPGSLTLERLADGGVAVGSPADVVRRGGVRVRVWQDGRVEERTLGGGVATRTTAAPLLLGPASRLGRTPLRDVALRSGTYVALLRAPGRVPQRFHFVLHPGAALSADLELVPAGAGLPGFVRIPRPDEGDAGGPFWVAERELTSAEYLEFLNDPSTLARVEASAEPVRFPRDGQNAARGGFWARGADGRFRLPDDWPGDWPVVGVSFEDAAAYAAWRTARAREAGEPWRFALPTLGQYLAAAGQYVGEHVHGSRFQPRWVKSCFARPRPTLEPGLRFPVDESVHGVFDLAGSVMEWCDDPMGERGELRRATGGSWAHGQADAFRIWSALSYAPDVGLGVVGVRLVAVREEPGR